MMLSFTSYSLFADISAKNPDDITDMIVEEKYTENKTYIFMMKTINAIKFRNTIWIITMLQP